MLHLTAAAGVAASAAGCAAFLPEPRETAPMVATNVGTTDGSIRLVFADGGSRDYLLPSGASVTLPADRVVVRDVLFRVDCSIAMQGYYGGDARPFSSGGQIEVGPGPDQYRFTTQPAASSSPPANPTTVCSMVPTPPEDAS